MLQHQPAGGAIRCAQTADLHTGFATFGPIDRTSGLPVRSIDGLEAFGRAVEAAAARGAEVLLVVGDAFNAARPEPTLVRELRERIRHAVERGLTVVISPGNHDIQVAEGRAPATDLFRHLPGVHVVDEIGLLRITVRSGELQILHLPWIFPQQLVAREEVTALTTEHLVARMHEIVRTRVAEMLAQADPAVPLVVMAHAIVPGATWGTEHEMWQGRDWVLPDGLFDDPRIRYVALGHMHRHQQVGFRPPQVYSGSIDRTNFSEESEPKGFVLFDVPPSGDATWEFVPLPTRTYRTLEADVTGSEMPMLALTEALAGADVADAVVRLEIHCRPEQAPHLRENEIRRLLTGAFHVWRIHKRTHSPEMDLDAERPSGEIEPLEAIARYLTMQGIDPERRARIIALAQELASETPAPAEEGARAA